MCLTVLFPIIPAVLQMAALVFAGLVTMSLLTMEAMYGSFILIAYGVCHFFFGLPHKSLKIHQIFNVFFCLFLLFADNKRHRLLVVFLLRFGINTNVIVWCRCHMVLDI